MSVVKNKSTDMGKAFWEHVEAVAAQVRAESVQKMEPLPRLIPAGSGQTVPIRLSTEE